MAFNPTPVDANSSEDTQKACQNASRRLKLENGVDCKDWKGIHTIFTVALQEYFRVLAEKARTTDGEVSLDIGSLVTFKIVKRVEEDAEKDGNLVPVAEFRSGIKQIVKNDALTEADE